MTQNSFLLQELAAARTSAAAGGGDTASGNASRGAMALETLRTEAEERPETIAAELRTLMARALGTNLNSPQDAFEYIRRYVSYAGNIDLSRAASLIASCWNAMEEGDMAAAHGRIALAFMAVDQASRDRRWEYASLIAHNAETPPEALHRRTPASLLQPHSRVVPARWVTAAQSYVRDSAASNEALSRLGKGDRKGKGKGKKGEDDAKAWES